jgi:hypothetical protein
MFELPLAAALDELVDVFSAPAQPATSAAVRQIRAPRRAVAQRRARIVMSHLLH